MSRATRRVRAVVSYVSNRYAWLTPYQGGVSTYDEDRNRGAGLPSGLESGAYDRIAQRLEDRRARQQRWAGIITGQPPAPPLAPPVHPQAHQAGQRRTAARQDGMQRFAAINAIAEAGFKRMAAGMYKKGHDIWELRHAEDGKGYCLVRKREERAVDLREMAALAGPGTAAAVATGAVRTAQVQPSSGGSALSRALSAVQVGRWEIALPALTEIPDWDLAGVPRRLIEGLRMEVRGELMGVEGRQGMPGEIVQAIKQITDKWERANPHEPQLRRGQVGCPQCGSRVDYLMTAPQQGIAWCSESARGLYARAASRPTRGGVPCTFQNGVVVVAPSGGLDLLARGLRGELARIGQLVPPAAAPELAQASDLLADSAADASMPPAEEMNDAILSGGDDPAPVTEDAFLDGQSEKVYDLHEVMHGREPRFNPADPEVEAMEQLIDGLDAGGDGVDVGAPELDEATTPSDGDADDDGTPDAFDGAHGPAAGKEAKCGAADHGQPSHKCAQRRTARRRSKYKGRKILAVRKGGVAEGIIIKIMPADGDILADFGEGEEAIPLDMVLDPELGPIDESDSAVDTFSSGAGGSLELEEEVMHEHEHEHAPTKKKDAGRAIFVTAEDLL